MDRKTEGQSFWSQPHCGSGDWRHEDTFYLLDLGFKVTTQMASYFYKNFERPNAVADASWVKLRQLIDILVIGCLEAAIWCLGQVFSQKCVFIVQDDYLSPEDSVIGVPRILAWNMLKDLNGLFGPYCSFQEDCTTRRECHAAVQK